LELQEEEKLGIQENYQTLQDEASLKEKKLKKLQNKLKIVNSEIAEYREEQVRMREELVLQREELDKQCRLRQMIIENFIPQREVERIMKRSIYEDDNWILVPTTHNSYPVASRPVNDGNHVRPMSLLAKQLAIKGEVRYMADNILKLDLDMPIRTTRDYTGPTVSASVQAVLDRAIQSEEEITIDASVYSNKSKQRQSKEKGKRMEGSSETRRSTDPRQNYPIKRGLVKT
jgi:kinesin family protein 3/17